MFDSFSAPFSTSCLLQMALVTALRRLAPCSIREYSRRTAAVTSGAWLTGRRSLTAGTQSLRWVTLLRANTLNPGSLSCMDRASRQTPFRKHEVKHDLSCHYRCTSARVQQVEHGEDRLTPIILSFAGVSYLFFLMRHMSWKLLAELTR